MAFRFTLARRRLFGIGARDGELHREARFTRIFDNTKLVLVTGGVMFVGISLMKMIRRAQLALSPESSTFAMQQRMDERLCKRPDLAIALVQMTVHHALSGADTPFGAPMVSPPHLAKEARDLEGLLVELMTFSSEVALSPADLWALMASKALLFIGGPTCHNKVGRPLDARSMKVEMREPLVAHFDRDGVKLRHEITRRGYRVSDIAALVGAYRSLGFHPGAQVHFDKETNQFVADEPTEAEKSLSRKTTTHPFVFSNDYFDELVQYNWKANSAELQPTAKSWRNGFGVFGTAKASPTLSGPNTFYTCDDGERAQLRVKYLIKNTGPSAPQTKEEAEAAAQKQDAPDAQQQGICSQIKMQPFDLSLLDDPILNGWTNRFADDESLYFVEMSKLFEDVLSVGYKKNTLVRAIDV